MRVCDVALRVYLHHVIMLVVADGRRIFAIFDASTSSLVDARVIEEESITIRVCAKLAQGRATRGAEDAKNGGAI